MLSCALVTTRAAPAFKPWHTRMPVVLDAAEQERWLDNQHPVAPDDTIFRSALKMPLVLRPVSRAVNNARNKALTAMAEGGAIVELDV
jgi:putative SOS response-associated peptidase YedK